MTTTDTTTDEYDEAPDWYRPDPTDFDRLQADMAAGMTYDGALIAQGLCPDLVPIMTEDGPSDGRCFRPITDDELGACEGHAEERRGWMAMDESERIDWEHRQDEDYR